MHTQVNPAAYRLAVAAFYTLFGFGAGVFYSLHEYVVMAIFLALSALTALTWRRTSATGIAEQPPHEYDWDDYYAGRFPPKPSDQRGKGA